MEDAGVSPRSGDGLVICPVTTTGAFWPDDKTIPMDVVNASILPATHWTALPS